MEWIKTNSVYKNVIIPLLSFIILLLNAFRWFIALYFLLIFSSAWDLLFNLWIPSIAMLISDNYSSNDKSFKFFKKIFILFGIINYNY